VNDPKLKIMKTKTLFMVLVAVLFTGTMFAQKISAQEGFKINPSVTSLTVNQGASSTMEVEILKSKRYANKDVELIVPSKLPEGLTMNITQPGIDNIGFIEVNASASTPAGTYPVIIQGKTRRLTKGTLVKIMVATKTISAR
jgi:uncharacterized membrane protein